MDGHDRLVPAEERANLPGQIVQRVLMLGKDDQLFAAAVRAEHLAVILQKPRKLVPLSVLAAGTDLVGHILQAAKGFDLFFQFRDGRGGRCLIRHVLFHILEFLRGIVVLVIVLFDGISVPIIGRPFAELFLVKAVLQAFAPPAEGLVDGLG